jgi:hypothetical protein
VGQSPDPLTWMSRPEEVSMAVALKSCTENSQWVGFLIPVTLCSRPGVVISAGAEIAVGRGERERSAGKRFLGCRSQP